MGEASFCWCSTLLQEVQAEEEGLEASAIRRGGTEMRALGPNHWENKQLQWIASVVTR